MIDSFLKPDWPVSPYVHACTTLRQGGFSKGTWAGLNLASHVGDNPFSVVKNRKFLRRALNLPSEPVWLKQVHGNQVVNAASGVTRTADASYSSEPRVVCAVLTADCLPILLYAADSCTVAAVHAGWRGLLNGVIQSTLAEIGAGCVAWLGPAIGPGAFEVGSEVRDAFVRLSLLFEPAFTSRAGDRWMADIYAISRIILQQNGVEHIHGGGYCTWTDAERFYSYRRDGVTGRMATLIWRD